MRARWSRGALRRLVATSSVSAILGVVGCSVKPAAPESPSYAPGGQPASTVPPGAPPADAVSAEEPGDPQVDLDEAEREIDRLFGGGFAEPPGPTAPSTGSDPTGLAEGAEDACQTACRALSSMQRAADRLCEIADDEARCDGARGRVQRARDRVTARCSACE